MMMRSGVKDLNRTLLKLKQPDSIANSLTKAAEEAQQEAQKHLNEAENAANAQVSAAEKQVAAAEKQANKAVEGVEKDINKQVAAAEKDINKGVQGVENDINKGIAGVEKDINQGVHGVEKDINQGVHGVEKDINKGIHGVEKDMEHGIKSAEKSLDAAATNILTQQQHGKPTLGYWSIRGRAWQCRMLLYHLGVSFEDKLWALGDDSPNGWMENKFSIGMWAPNLPYWHDGEVYHSGAMPVLRSICRKHKPEYLGRTLKEQAAVDAYVDHFYPQVDPWLATYFMAPDYANKYDEGSQAAIKILEQVNDAKGHSRFLAGDELTYADFMINWLFRVFRLYNEDVFTGFDGLILYHKRYLGLPGIKEGDEAQEDMLWFPPVGWQADNMV